MYCIRTQKREIRSCVEGLCIHTDYLTIVQLMLVHYWLDGNFINPI